MARITLEEVQETLRPIGWVCLSECYKNLDTMLTFKCEEGHQVHSTWRKVRVKPHCPVCESNLHKQMFNIKGAPKKKGSLRVLAFDQSSKKNGFSVFDDDVLRGYGVYSTTKDAPLDRMIDICDWVISMINAWEPDLVGFEETQYNPNSGMGHDVFKLLSQVMGAAMVAAARERVEVDTVLIPTWRGHCGVKGRHRADQKRSAQLLVKKWYDITVSDDESDAICIGRYLSSKHAAVKDTIGEWI